MTLGYLELVQCEELMNFIIGGRQIDLVGERGSQSRVLAPLVDLDDIAIARKAAKERRLDRYLEAQIEQRYRLRTTASPKVMLPSTVWITWARRCTTARPTNPHFLPRLRPAPGGTSFSSSSRNTI